MQEKGLTNKKVAEITGLKGKTITYYATRGLVLPSISEGAGRGGNRLYSKKDCLKLMLIRELSAVGLKLQEIERFFELENIRQLFLPKDPERLYGNYRVIIAIYDPHRDMRGDYVFLMDPEAVPAGEPRERAEENLSKITFLDLRKFSSAVFLDITKIWKKLP